jgi:hypothetical protein
MDVTTGHQLRVERVAARVGVNEIAAAMRVSRTTIWSIERQALVRHDHVLAYRDAIARLSRSVA